MSISEIIEGWKNHLFPQNSLKELITNTSATRMAICNECPKHSKNFSSLRGDDHCTVCGCTLLPKTKCLSCKCPEDRWLPILSEEEEKKIKEYENINGKEITPE